MPSFGRATGRSQQVLEHVGNGLQDVQAIRIKRSAAAKVAGAKTATSSESGARCAF